MSLRRSSRSAPLLTLTAALVAGALALSACTFGDEPAPGSPSTPNQLSTEGFPPPGPAPQPGRITSEPVGPAVAPEAPRPERGPVPTPGPETSQATPRPTGNPAPPPGS